MSVYEWKLSKVVYVKSSNVRGVNFDGEERKDDQRVDLTKAFTWLFQPLSLC